MKAVDRTPRFKSKKKWGWYKKKSFPHFDIPLNPSKAAAFVANFKKNPVHPFYPFLAYEKKSRRYKGHDNISVKKRPIKYAAHKDGYLYSFFTMTLSKQYEARIRKLGISSNVIAYRSNIGSNIHFAKQAFDEIVRRQTCVALALDISGFFDHIDHEKLKVEWAITVGVKKLPEDHFALFKALTRWVEVDRDMCYERLKKHAPFFDVKNPPRPICKPDDFRNIIKGKTTGEITLIRKNTDSGGQWRNYGIPQGTALSSLLSNVYMIPFDLTMNELAKKIGGYYRRYSDDILWIFDERNQDMVLKSVDEALKERGDHLERKEDKTDVSIFKLRADGIILCDKPIQYLGFTFDGKKSLIRSATLSRYARRLKYATRSALRAARKATKNGKIFKPYRKKLNRKLTHLGRESFIRNYAYRAQEKMGGKAIRKQVSGNLERVTKEMKSPRFEDF